MITLHRTALRRRIHQPSCISTYQYHVCHRLQQSANDSRLTESGNIIEDDFAVLKDTYQAPKHPVILAHGLLGFDELHVPGLPGVQYWHGIRDALAAKGVEVITAAVPASGRIEVRAQRLAEAIESKAGGKSVNIIA